MWCLEASALEILQVFWVFFPSPSLGEGNIQYVSGATSSFRVWQAPGVTGPIPEWSEAISVGKVSGAWQGQGGPGGSRVRGQWCPVLGQEASKWVLELLLSPRFHGDPRVVVRGGVGGRAGLGGSWPHSADGLSHGSRPVEPAGAGVGQGPLGEGAFLLSVPLSTLAWW